MLHTTPDFEEHCTVCHEPLSHKPFHLPNPIGTHEWTPEDRSCPKCGGPRTDEEVEQDWICGRCAAG